jgi:hypothetical protein
MKSYQHLVVEGPELDLQQLWRRFINQYELAVGPTPNVFVNGDHHDWVVRSLEELEKLRAKYNVRTDLEGIFVALLQQEYGFKIIETVEVTLT